jgi:hypothetical protein
VSRACRDWLRLGFLFIVATRVLVALLWANAGATQSEHLSSQDFAERPFALRALALEKLLSFLFPLLLSPYWPVGGILQVEGIIHAAACLLGANHNTHEQETERPEAQTRKEANKQTNKHPNKQAKKRCLTRGRASGLHKWSAQVACTSEGSACTSGWGHDHGFALRRDDSSIKISGNKISFRISPTPLKIPSMISFGRRRSSLQPHKLITLLVQNGGRKLFHQIHC